MSLVHAPLSQVVTQSMLYRLGITQVSSASLE